MTNKEALQAQSSLLQNVTSESIEFYLMEQSLTAADTYVSGNRQALDMALAGLLFVMATSPKSISELDYSITQQDIDGLLKLRASLYKKWSVADPMVGDQNTITGRSPW